VRTASLSALSASAECAKFTCVMPRASSADCSRARPEDAAAAACATASDPAAAAPPAARVPEAVMTFMGSDDRAEYSVAPSSAIVAR